MTDPCGSATTHRADAPSQLWAGMLERVQTNLDLAARDRLEGLGGTLPGRIRSTVTHLEPLLSNPGVSSSRRSGRRRSRSSRRVEARVSKRTDYYHDPAAPAANSLVVGGSAVVVDDEGRILLQRRRDSGNWALPGGAMDIGETFAESMIREVKEETGFDVRIERIVGIYSDPGHVFAYDDGEVRQEFNICLACTIIGGELAVSSESTDVRCGAWVRASGRLGGAGNLVG